MKSIRRAASVTAALLLLCSTVAMAQDAPSIEGHWEGSIEVPGQSLEINLDFTNNGDAWQGDISIPAQGLQDGALADIVVDGKGAKFKIDGVPGDPTFDGTLTADGDRLEGTFSQGGMNLDFSLERGDRAAERARQALEGFDEFIEQAIADWKVPGTAMAVVVDDELVYSKGFGLRDVEAQLPMTPDSLFAIGSTSKAFTTTLLGMFSDDGLMDWDAPLREYLPRFELQDPLATQLMTPRDLVTHRSGLPRHDALWYNNNDVTREDLVRSLKYLEPSADFRQRFQYNNLMYLTAGYLAEVLGEKTWEELVAERITGPLGMERTTFDVKQSQKDSDFAQPHRKNDDDELEVIPFRDISLIGPAGSINSSVNEMSEWLRFNLRGGTLDGEQLIETSTLKDIHAPHMAIAAPPSRPEIQPGGYGLGWSVDTYRGHRRISHGGGIDGFITAVALFPDDGLGIVTFVNIGSGLPNILRNHAADRVLGLEPIDWNAEALTEMREGEKRQEEAEEKLTATRKEGTSPTHELAEFAGTYEHPGYGPLDVSLDGDTLSVSYNGISAPVEHWHYNVFNAQSEAGGDEALEDTKFQFRLDVDGAVSSVEARMEPAVDPIVFGRQADASMTDPAFLDRLVGEYVLEPQIVEIKRSGETLQATLPGQPTFTLLPDLEGRFRLKEVATITVEFEIGDEGPATKLTFYQPNGVFEAKRRVADE